MIIDKLLEFLTRKKLLWVGLYVALVLLAFALGVGVAYYLYLKNNDWLNFIVIKN